MANRTPSLSFFQSAWYVYLPVGKGKYQRQYVCSGSAEQKAEYLSGSKPNPTLEQQQAYLDLLKKVQQATAGERIGEDKGQAHFGTVAGLFLQSKRGKVSAMRFTNLTRFVESFSAEYGQTAIQDVTAEQIEAWIAGKKRWQSPNTRRDAIKSVRSVLTYAIERQVIPNSAALKSKLERAKKQDEYRLTKQDEATIATIPVLAFMLATGCRPSEAFGIEAKQVRERTDGTLCIEVKDHKGSYLGKRRIIEASLTREAESLTRQACQANPNGKIFSTKSGKPWTVRRLDDLVNVLKAQGKLGAEFVPYDCRHAFINRQARNGRPIQHLAEFVGNSVSTLEKYYLHSDSDEARMAMIQTGKAAV